MALGLTPRGSGLWVAASATDNPVMKKNSLAFKETQLFEWDSEPKDERPSEFHTTGFSSASGYYHSLGGPVRAAPARQSSLSGKAMLLLGLTAALGVGAVAVLWLAQLLRG